MSSPSTSRSRRVSVPDCAGRSCSRSSAIRVSALRASSARWPSITRATVSCRSAADDRRSMTASAPARISGMARSRGSSPSMTARIFGAGSSSASSVARWATASAPTNNSSGCQTRSRSARPGPCARSPTNLMPPPWVTTWMRPCRSSSSFSTNTVRIGAVAVKDAVMSRLSRELSTPSTSCSRRVGASRVCVQPMVELRPAAERRMLAPVALQRRCNVQGVASGISTQSPHSPARGAW